MSLNTGKPIPVHLPTATISSLVASIPIELGYVDAAITADSVWTLPPIQAPVSSLVSGAQLIIRNSTFFTITLLPSPLDTIDGAASVKIQPGTTITLIVDVQWKSYGVTPISDAPVYPPPRIVRNAMSELDPGTIVLPPQPTMAIGPEVVVAMVNSTIAIFDKITLERIFIEDFSTFMGGIPVPFYPQVVYDPLSQRFFISTLDVFRSDAEVVIDSGPAAGTYLAVKGAAAPNQVPFNISATIEATVPFNANTTVTNNLTGKIALIATDGYRSVPGGLGSNGKGNNAVAAGAIGCLFYGSNPNDVVSIFGASDVPSVGVRYVDGLIIAPNMPVSGTIRSVAAVNQVFINTVYFAVSKVPNPKTAADWYKYSYQMPDIVQEQDAPIIAVDDTNMWYASTNFVNEVLVGTLFVPFDKSALLDGTGPIAGTSTFYPAQNLLQPTQTIYPKTDVLQPQYFIGTDAQPFSPNVDMANNLVIVTTLDLNTKILVPLPAAMTFDYSIGMPQPDPTLAPLETNRLSQGASIVKNDRLWWSTSWTPNSTQTIIRWFELDISQVVNGGGITIVQYGDIYPANNGNCACSCIAVDDCGNMAIGFTICGPQQVPSIAYTWRKASDPPGITRPITILLDGIYNYDGGEQFVSSGLKNRWGSNNYLVYKDGKFWLFNEYPIQLSDWVDPDAMISYGYSTAIIVFDLESGCAGCLSTQKVGMVAKRMNSAAKTRISAIKESRAAHQETKPSDRLGRIRK